jgi:glycosyltransferase involved in cell wall biosynthesis
VSRDVVFAVPGDLTTPTGGYVYDRRVIAELATLGWNIRVLDLGSDFPRPGRKTVRAAHGQLAGAPPGCPIVIDGLAFGALPEIAAELAGAHPLIALVHHPLALETGLSPADCKTLLASERAALAHACRVVVTSASTARLLRSDYGVAEDRLTVAPPGTDPAPLARGSADGVIALLAVGAVVPRKGYDVLIAALARIAELPWRLTIAGDCRRDVAEARRLAANIRRHRLAARVTVAGIVSNGYLCHLYSGADVFVLASRFEGYGMAYAQALAHGLPVIATTAGATPDTVPSSAGILVPPDDAEALARAVRRLIADPAERRRLAAAARAHALRLPSWRRTAELVGGAIEAAR